MPKTKPIPVAIRQRGSEAVVAAWQAGSPVAPRDPEAQSELVAVCWRRYQTLARRGIAVDDVAGQVRDLAQGIVQASGLNLKAIGPLIRDYEWLAGQVLSAIRADVPGN